MTAAHHNATHKADAKRVVAAAKHNPDAVCWRDGHTLTQHPPHHDGTPAQWQGGHTIDGYTNPPVWLSVTRRPPPGPWLAPEASTCNTSNGARRTNRFRANPRSRQWRA